jgi:putative endopeptidase
MLNTTIRSVAVLAVAAAGALAAAAHDADHSPAKFRINGVVRNVAAWYAAFNVQPGEKLYLAPDERVHIW